MKFLTTVAMVAAMGIGSTASAEELRLSHQCWDPQRRVSFDMPPVLFMSSGSRVG